MKAYYYFPAAIYKNHSMHRWATLTLTIIYYQ